MDRFLIAGGKKLSGTVKTDGSKNAGLPIIAGTILIGKGETTLENIPPLRDIFTIKKVLEHLGAIVNYDPKVMRMKIDSSHINENTAPYELMRQMRASFLVLGPLLGRLGEARVSLPGGCSLGARPVDYHINGFRNLGAEILEEAGYVIAKAKPLKGATIHFDRPSHTGTENIMFGATLAKGTTRIVNAACDPEVADVAEFLNAAGAKIHGAGTSTITIEGVKNLNPVKYKVSGDRLVAGTYMCAAAITGGSVEIAGINPSHLTMVSRKLYEMGCNITEGKSNVKISAPKRLKPIKVVTFPFPGFPTDLQACIMALATVADGTSSIKETVFEDRFGHTMELRRLGADVTVTSDEAIVRGVEKLQGAAVMASDIRAGAGLVLACLAAQGQSEVLRVYHIDRGYYQLEEKLSSLGADIKRAIG
ncbi:MAG: UDP-N-acetylglucosamine 1-carboxyvinyltransferase [candidate division Zixibacteria bacterium]|nr:UDP-N-acetylglucosamine 1-carboxyvinyltransferase [candidate division Zixibacteria bacterium]